MESSKLEAQVKRSLQYLMDEGIVIQEGELYRLKTEEEIAEELRLLLEE